MRGLVISSPRGRKASHLPGLHNYRLSGRQLLGNGAGTGGNVVKGWVFGNEGRRYGEDRIRDGGISTIAVTNSMRIEEETLFMAPILGVLASKACSRDGWDRMRRERGNTTIGEPMLSTLSGGRHRGDDGPNLWRRSS